MNKFDLENRLVDFSVAIIKVSEELSHSHLKNHLATQLFRSGTSVSLNYGEAQSAESRKDFIHKMSIILKELRETFVCLRIISKTDMIKDLANLENVKKENDELISIFVKSIETARKNQMKSNNLS